MNKDFYKATLSSVRHSDELTERIMDMTTEKKKTIKMKPVFAVAACLILLVAGIFGGSAISAKINAVNPDNMFTITAYAKGKEINLKDTPIVKTDLHLEYVDSNTVAEKSQGFHFDGKNIKSVTYTSEHGELNYQTRIGNDVKVTREERGFNPDQPYASALVIEVGNDEAVDIYYSPSEAIDAMLHADKNSLSMNLLVNDTIIVTVEYKDGTTAKATINTFFDKDGNMQLEYQE